jgi:hypothetical protein
MAARETSHRFIEVFSRVFVLEIDLQTLNRRLTARPEAELSRRPAEQRLIRRLHATSCLPESFGSSLFAEETAADSARKEQDA